MDENKEALSPEEETQAVLTETDTENTDAPAAPENDILAQTGVEDFEEEALDEAAEESAEEDLPAEDIKPKKSVLNKTIIISLAVVCVAVIAALVVRLFFFQGVVRTDFLGNRTDTTWHYGIDMPYFDDTATGDEVIKTKTIDCFYEFRGDGTLVSKVGTVETAGSYTLEYLTAEDIGDTENGDEKIGTPVCKIELFDPVTGYPLDGTYYYEVSGNVFTGRNLKLTDVTSDTSVLEYDEKSYEKPALSFEDGTQTDDKAIGSWTYQNESITETFTFNSDGTFKVADHTPQYDITQSGIYTCKDGVMTLKTKFVDEQTSELTYRVEDNAFVVTREIEGQSTDISYEKN